jgi:hypothetical protein
MQIRLMIKSGSLDQYRHSIQDTKDYLDQGKNNIDKTKKI